MHIYDSYRLTLVTDSLTIIYEDNVDYVVQVKGRFIKGNKIKYILPKKFHTYELLKMDKLMFNKFVPPIILQIYLLNLCQHQCLINYFTALVWGELIKRKINCSKSGKHGLFQGDRL